MSGHDRRADRVANPVSAIVAFRGWPGDDIVNGLGSLGAADQQPSVEITGPAQIAAEAAPAAAGVAASPPAESRAAARGSRSKGSKPGQRVASPASSGGVARHPHPVGDESGWLDPGRLDPGIGLQPRAEPAVRSHGSERWRHNGQRRRHHQGRHRQGRRQRGRGRSRTRPDSDRYGRHRVGRRGRRGRTGRQHAGRAGSLAASSSRLLYIAARQRLKLEVVL
jgi:hypothetical protein